MKKLLFLGWICLFSTLLYSENITPLENVPNFVVLSMPKAGSHLLFKAIHRMTGLKPSPVDGEVDLTTYESPGNGYPSQYLALPDHLLKNHLKDKSLKKIILVRDLRDISISQVFHIEHQGPGTWLHDAQISLYSSQSLDKKLIFFMVQNTHYNSSPKKVAAQVLKLSSLQNTHLYKNVLVCRFENLIGPQGGGTSLTEKSLKESLNF